MPVTDHHDDRALLRLFATDNSEVAFATLVSRHVSLVHSAALRQTGDPHAAEEITQAVFIILARKAGSLGGKVVLPGWLYQTARLTAANHLRTEIRRARREQEAHMNSHDNENTADDATWQQIAPLLDTAMGGLNEADRNAIVLRYFENKSMGEIAAVLDAPEATARKRVTRAVERLRKFFTKRGVTLTAAAIVGAVSAGSVQAAPAGLAATISTVALTKGAMAGGSTLALVKGALKLMAWAKMKTAVVVGATILAAGTVTTVVVEKVVHRSGQTAYSSWADDPKNWVNDSRVLERLPGAAFILRPTKFPNEGGGVQVGNRIVFKNVPMEWLISSANDHSEFRSLFPSDLPEEHFDLMFTASGDWANAVQQEIKQRFGLVARREIREVDVLLARVRRSPVPGLIPARRSGSAWIGNHRNHVLEGQSIDAVTQWLQSYFKMPILNQTGLTNLYDMTLKWKPLPGQSENDAIRQLLLTQFGLELVPAREKIEMLVVEKVK